VLPALAESPAALVQMEAEDPCQLAAATAAAMSDMETAAAGSSTSGRPAGRQRAGTSDQALSPAAAVDTYRLQVLLLTAMMRSCWWGLIGGESSAACLLSRRPCGTRLPAAAVIDSALSPIDAGAGHCTRTPSFPGASEGRHGGSSSRGSSSQRGNDSSSSSSRAGAARVGQSSSSSPRPLARGSSAKWEVAAGVSRVVPVAATGAAAAAVGRPLRHWLAAAAAGAQLRQLYAALPAAAAQWGAIRREPLPKVTPAQR